MKPPDAGTWRLMWRIALPVLAEEFLTLLVGYTDWWLAGHFLRSAEYLAAMSLLAYLMWLLNSAFAGVAIGATAMVARFTGAGDSRMAARVVLQSLLLGAMLAFVVMLVVSTGGRTFIALLQLRGRSADLVWQYLRIVVPAIPFMMLQQVSAACLRGAGDSVSGLLAKLVMNGVNAALSPLLLLGVGFFPELGWKGLAVGTAAGHFLGGTVLLAILLSGRGAVRLPRDGWGIDRELQRRLWRVGVPGGIDAVSVVTCHLAYVAIINRLGTAAAAAHGLGLQIEALSYLPGSAYHVAAATLAGQFLGAGEPRRARRGVLLACATGCAVMSCAAVAFVLAGDLLTGFFTGDRHDPTARHAASLLRIVAVSTPSLAVLSILTGGLRGAGDTRWPLIVTFIGLLGIRLPGACLLAWGVVELPQLGLVVTGMNWGVDGAWWAMTTDVIVRSVLIASRFLHGGWQRVQV
ncbi:MAG: MATE family efflux transporter [Pirellulaceae bacterium]